MNYEHDILCVPTLSDLFADTVLHNQDHITTNDGYPDMLPVPDSTAMIINERRKEMREVERRKQSLRQGMTHNAGRGNSTPESDILPIPTINWKTGEIV